MLGLALVAFWPPIPGRAQQEPILLPQSEETAVLEVSRRLARVDARLRAETERVGTRELRLERLRLLYFLSVAEERYMVLAEGEIAWLREAGAPEPVLRAFAGALEVVRGKHAFWPHDKVGHVRGGLAVLDEAIRRAPESRDVRYLRLLSCFYLPFFFGRGDTVDEDLGALAGLLTRGPGSLSPGSYVAVADFVLLHAELTDGERDALRASRLRLSLGDGQATRGREPGR